MSNRSRFVKCICLFFASLLVCIPSVAFAQNKVVVIPLFGDEPAATNQHVITTNENTAIGKGALQSNTTGSNNVAAGYQALNANTTGANNTALGHLALEKNVSGYANVGVGRSALWYNTSGHSNTAVWIWSRMEFNSQPLYRPQQYLHRLVGRSEHNRRVQHY